MVIVRLSGGLGNQMFQYALGKHLSVLGNTQLKIDISSFQTDQLRNFELDKFKIKANLVSELEVQMLSELQESNTTKRWLSKLYHLVTKQIVVYNEKNLSYDPFILKFYNSWINIVLKGCWQNELYFRGIRHQIIEDFSPKEELSFSKNSYLPKIESQTSVSLHVRRGDYVHDKATQSIHGVCSLDYYHLAVEVIKKTVKKPHFFVFSDDTEWVAKNISLAASTTYVSGNTAASDLLLMAKCKHHITANSTFSWWGAWLNQQRNKIVICPKMWYWDSKLEKQTTNLIPQDWIRL